MPPKYIHDLSFNDITSFELAAGLGLIDGVQVLSKFGLNPDADASVPVDVWEGDGKYVWLDNAEPITLVSTSANDSINGTGARTVQVYGLDANYVEQTETVELNGLTPVPLQHNYLRMNRMIVRSAGSSGGAEGVIDAVATTSAVVQARIVNGYNQTQMCLWTVPAGKMFLLKYFEGTNGKGKQVLYDFKARPYGEVFQTKKTAENYESKIDTTLPYPLPFDEKTDMIFSAVSDTNQTLITGQFVGLIIDKNEFGLA